MDFLTDVAPVPMPDITPVPDQTVSVQRVRVWKVAEKGIYKVIGSDQAMMALMKTMQPGVGITAMMINTAQVDLREFFADGGFLVSEKDIK